MDKRRSMTRNRNNHSVSTKKRFKKGCTGPWADLNHQVLYSVMTQLSVIDFVAFSGVCKSWRSLAVSNRNEFMASKPPMSIRVTNRPYKKECYLEDFEGKKFRSFLPRSVGTGRYCIGLASGYLIMFSHNDNDYRLLNPITRHELHFPRRPPFRNVPPPLRSSSVNIRAVLVFSPTTSEWVFVTTHRNTREIWFSTAGEGSWNAVYVTFPILDLHVFKGKIYTLNFSHDFREVRHLCEMSFSPEPKLTILEPEPKMTKPATVNLFDPSSPRPEFASSSENLFVVQPISEQECKIHEPDVGEMRWVSHEKTSVEYAVFQSRCKSSAAVKPLSWADLWSRTFADTPPSGNARLVVRASFEDMWYFPRDSFNVDRLEL